MSASTCPAFRPIARGSYSRRSRPIPPSTRGRPPGSTDVNDPTELLWLDERGTVTLSELARACGLTEDELSELVEYGAVSPVQALPSLVVFSAAAVPSMRAAGKLRRDYDLDLFAVALLVEYLDRIARLEREVAALEAELPGRLDRAAVR
ncbi:MAG: hypothetical protein EOO22_01230 [Comamonadaceae bacterium]|nr:MAG: hypothetical protein EOO22_01230 [Comamonadaceae bacterium]